ncbi:MAG: GntR family transcriptional regulator [Proteobacteria bacterium]|jgi:DNA-binding GntR family transcriptional regulator|nr:GntR family transcriptional regulator [Pseudomonadota bacterium]
MADKLAENNPVDSSTQNETLASSVYHALLDDILAGKLIPGHKLRLQALKNDYNVGNSPLREALNRLSANGMVVREENKGFRVSPASISELQELIRTRCWLEEIALRESIRNANDQYDERIVLAYHRVSKLALSNGSSYSSPEQENKHREFHQSLISACNSKILLKYCEQLHEQTLRYRNLAAVVQYREGHEGDEHRAIRDAVLERKADIAVDLLTSHYKITAEIVISSGSLSQT